MSLPETTRHTLIARLNEVLSQESLLSDAETMRPYECYGLSGLPPITRSGLHS